MASSVQWQAPHLAPWMRNLLIGLFGLYIVELVLANLRVPVDLLRLFPIGGGFAPWQPFTRFLVQGREAAVGVLISLVVLYFFLPILPRLLDRRSWVEILIATAVVATGLPMLVDLAGVLPLTDSTGWGFLIPALIVVFGLAQPNAQVNLMFVLPIPASVFVWGTLFLALFFLLAQPSSAAVEPVGAWLGAVGWWQFRGPGSRRRKLLAHADKVERELRRFTVHEGGRGGKQGSQGGKGDDWVN